MWVVQYINLCVITENAIPVDVYFSSPIGVDIWAWGSK